MGLTVRAVALLGCALAAVGKAKAHRVEAGRRRVAGGGLAAAGVGAGKGPAEALAMAERSEGEGSSSTVVPAPAASYTSMEEVEAGRL